MSIRMRGKDAEQFLMKITMSKLHARTLISRAHKRGVKKQKAPEAEASGAIPSILNLRYSIQVDRLTSNGGPYGRIR